MNSSRAIYTAQYIASPLHRTYPSYGYSQLVSEASLHRINQVLPHQGMAAAGIAPHARKGKLVPRSTLQQHLLRLGIEEEHAERPVQWERSADFPSMMTCIDNLRDAHASYLHSLFVALPTAVSCSSTRMHRSSSISWFCLAVVDCLCRRDHPTDCIVLFLRGK